MAKRGILSFREERCKGCELCVSACARGLLALGEDYNTLGYHPARLVKPEACNGCGLCAMMCPDMVIEIAVEEESA